MDLFEDYVSYDTAKLLKEKGFDESIETLIGPEEIIYHLDENSISRQIHSTISNSEINIYSEGVSCPTLQMAMKWLREVHNLDIIVPPQFDNSKWTYSAIIFKLSIPCTEIRLNDNKDKKEQACEAAIKYCLENLV